MPIAKGFEVASSPIALSFVAYHLLYLNEPQSDIEASKAEYKEDSAKRASEANFYGIRADPFNSTIVFLSFALAISFEPWQHCPFTALLLAARLFPVTFCPGSSPFAHSDNGVKVSLGKHYRAVGYALSRKIFMECRKWLPEASRKVLKAVRIVSFWVVSRACLNPGYLFPLSPSARTALQRLASAGHQFIIELLQFLVLKFPGLSAARLPGSSIPRLAAASAARLKWRSAPAMWLKTVASIFASILVKITNHFFFFPDRSRFSDQLWTGWFAPEVPHEMPVTQVATKTVIFHIQYFYCYRCCRSTTARKIPGYIGPLPSVIVVTFSNDFVSAFSSEKWYRKRRRLSLFFFSASRRRLQYQGKRPA